MRREKRRRDARREERQGDMLMTVVKAVVEGESRGKEEREGKEAMKRRWLVGWL